MGRLGQSMKPPILVLGLLWLVASARAVPDDPRIELLLPLAHPYETAGTYLNFAGLAQPLAPGGFRQQGVLQDHVLLGRLHQALTKNLSTSR